ncbi:unnamed protein product [Candidula unifasciata]|uniref:G-protein coupled receptors family 1 profile domain-containing protein n=1 Tax=Candidula unifasciata TaxID=100452 RepID=A0A8S3Z4M9_9EUPU|nr:unnamed protein product [Candidula unifasciata]
MNSTTKATNLARIMNESQYSIVLLFFCVAWTICSMLGIASNVINIKTFVAMGLNDSVTVSFLTLSVFDLAYVITTFCFAVSSAFSLIEQTYPILFPIEPYGVYVYFGNVLVLINVNNTLTTTFLAVARCMCVAKPLHFKHTFTVKRTVVIMTAFAIFAVAIYTPILANMGMVYRLDAKTNTSRPTLWLSPNRESTKNIVWTIIQIILPIATEFIVLVCIVIMINSLRAASKFRQASHITVCANDSSCLKGKTGSSNVANEKLSGKEIRVVKQVTLISLVYILCNTPKIMISIGGLVEQEFRIGKTYGYLYLCLNCFRMQFEILNASINTFVYYAFNTKFKTTLCWK